MLHGDCMSLMMTMPEASYDAVITDPPYASGGLSTAARAQDPRVKYQQSGTRNDDRPTVGAILRRMSQVPTGQWVIIEGTLRHCRRR